MTTNSIDIWQASQFQIQLGGYTDVTELRQTYFANLKSFVIVYNSTNFHDLPMSSVLFYDVQIAFQCYYRQFNDYINNHTGGLCKHIYDLDNCFQIDTRHLEINYPKLSCMSKRQKYIYSVLANSVKNYVGSY